MSIYEDIAGAVNVTIPQGTVKKITRKTDGVLIWEKPVSASPVLNDNEWATISDVAASGQAANYWNVGDSKAVLVRGTVGTLSVNQTLYVYIIGFDHNGATNTIDFGTFKTELSGGKDICLTDSNYGKYTESETKYFNMNHGDGEKSWKGCDLRYDVLGSTKTKGSDAATNTATSPVSGTLMAALPSDLRAVMKPMTIHTDNGGDGVTSSVDYLPLLAEFEIFGTKTGANPTEQKYQKQYSYYSLGNSKLKNDYSSQRYAAYWWERSPRYSIGVAFCCVDTNGNAKNRDATYSNGIAPVFRI